MTSEAASYLSEVIDYIQLYSIKKGDMDWQAIRSEALARIRSVQTTADTYPTLRWVLSCLGDRHSFLISPQGVQKRQEGIVTSLGIRAVYPEGVIVDVHANSPAEHAGLQVRDVIETVNGVLSTQLDRATFMRTLYTSPLSLTFRRANQAVPSSATLHAESYRWEMKPQGWPLRPDIGYLELPGVTGSELILKAYAETANQLIRTMEQAGIHHWIIDLRRNSGGDMWAMVAGVSSLLGEGECGFFVSPEGMQTSWIPNKIARTRTLLDEPYHLTHTSGAIAVLTSRLTASSGEFTTLAFRGRPHTRSFGEPTRGLPTANHQKTLRDGAQIFLTVAYGADRTGCVYAGPIMPDQPLTSDWTLFQTAHDPVTLAAIDWLKALEGET